MPPHILTVFNHWCRGLEFTVPLILVLLGGAILVCVAL